MTGNTTFKIANFRRGLISTLVAKGHRVSVCSPPDEYVSEIESIGCEYVPLTMDRNGMSVVAEAALLTNIMRLIWKKRPDIVLGFTIKNNIYSGIACQILNLPFVPNVTGLGPAFESGGIVSAIVRHLYKVSFRKAKSVFFQNKEDLELFTNGKLCSKSVARLLPGSGVDLRLFAESPLRAASNESVRFLLVARMLWDKGVGQFIEAARTVKRLYPKSRFQLLGPLDPDSRSGIPEEQIQAWVAEGVVDYLGSTHDVRPHLVQADCVVLPSYYREGTPRSLLEACAIGRPIITTDTPGCRDVVRDGSNGILVAPRDVNALVEACYRILRATPEQRSKMGRAGRRIAEAHYDERSVIDAYFSILKELQGS